MLRKKFAWGSWLTKMGGDYFKFFPSSPLPSPPSKAMEERGIDD
jgi:hypothetical protein